MPSGLRPAALVAGDLVVEHRVSERHGDRLGRLEAQGGIALLLVLDAREVDHAHHDLLVGDAKPDFLGETSRPYEGAEHIAERRAVHDLAVTDDAFRKIVAGGSDDAPAGDLSGSEVLAVDGEADAAVAG
jgi:hypothetical protein